MGRSSRREYTKLFSPGLNLNVYVEGVRMMTKLIDVLFGCRHSRYSFPVTLRGKARRPQAAALTGTYVACLDCGREFPYDWQEMKVITSPAEKREYVAALATKHAA
jgi:hypothetical protein